MSEPALFAYTQNSTILVPDNRIKEITSDHILLPLRGYGYTLACLDKSKVCVGFVVVDDLGYKTVKDWILGTKWVDGGL